MLNLLANVGLVAVTAFAAVSTARRISRLLHRLDARTYSPYDPDTDDEWDAYKTWLRLQHGVGWRDISARRMFQLHDDEFAHHYCYGLDPASIADYYANAQEGG